jgi:hypothetical protein
MFRLAHLTDPHLAPLARPRLRELFNKRITGWYNWSRSRGDTHDMELLASLVVDIHAQKPDHVACTGDVSNIGMRSEWPAAKVFMEGLGQPEAVSFVPGNHDAYVQGSLEGLLAEIGPWTLGDGGGEVRFPYLRRRGNVALVGMSSAIPTLPFVATGKVGRRQFAASERLFGGTRPGPRLLSGRHDPPSAPHRRGAARPPSARCARVRGAPVALDAAPCLWPGQRNGPSHEQRSSRGHGIRVALFGTGGPVPWPSALVSSGGNHLDLSQRPGRSSTSRVWSLQYY